MSDAQLHPYVNVSLYDHPKKTSAPQKKATLKRQEEKSAHYVKGVWFWGGWYS